jgi:hypothetical protein
MKDIYTVDNGGTTVLDLPPTDEVGINTGENKFDNWRKKFKNYATVLTYRKLGEL